MQKREYSNLEIGKLMCIRERNVLFCRECRKGTLLRYANTLHVHATSRLRPSHATLEVVVGCAHAHNRLLLVAALC